MIQYSKQTDERREAGPMECWCLHGAVGMAADWRGFAKSMAATGIGTRAIDSWRFLECCPMPLTDFGKALNADASGEVFRGSSRALLGYSMGGRMALHSLLEDGHPWQAAIIVSAHPGLDSETERADRRASDAGWATQALAGDWQKFLTAWNAQPILGDAAMRDPQASGRLIMRRREIARSFVDWSLGAQEPLWDRLGKITIPVLWVAGENDTKFRALAERASSLIPKGCVAIAPGTGHRVPWAAETWFAETVGSFLKLGYV
ncbi:MAG: alpha/beta fold hydrolase [Luteolibacter sp.]|uniref:alpha/beta fold hydrolase n=1 Tax=Luteolibacter sp. TaxID=1962973 RepID=UPI003265844A